MDEEQYLRLFEEFISDQDLIKLEQNLKVFNLMRVFNISTSETSFSTFLSWLLDPCEDHGVDEYFLRYFLMECAKFSKEFNLIDIDKLSLNEGILQTEESFSGKKTDITIRIDRDKFLCLIENKVKGSEGEGQTETYVQLSKKKYPDYNIMYVFLTPMGIEAKAKKFISLSYREIKDLMIQTINAKEHIINEEILILLKQFIQNLEVNILNEGEIRKLCEEIYERHKVVIEKIIEYKPKYMDIIKEELKSSLSDEWETHTTKGLCYIYKKEWFEEFQEFYYNIPFFNYVIWSNPKGGELSIDIDFYIEKPKIVDIRDTFNKILDEEMKKNPPSHYTFSEKNIAVKFRQTVLEGGYETKDELKDVVKEMKSLIDDTLPSIENTIRIFKNKHRSQIKEWKDKLRST